MLAIDPGDVNRDGAPKSECRTKVRDGGKDEIVGGYPLISVVARDVKRGTKWLLLTRLLSPARDGYRSENTDFLEVMDSVQCRLKEQPLWMIVVDHDKQECLVLVTTRLVRGRCQGERIIQAYLDR